jgi:hypothetical protein
MCGTILLKNLSLGLDHTFSLTYRPQLVMAIRLWGPDAGHARGGRPNPTGEADTTMAQGGRPCQAKPR